MKAVKMQAHEKEEQRSAKVIPLPVARSKVTRLPLSPLDERYFGKPIRLHVREFGALFGALFFAIAAMQLWKGREPLVPSLFIAAGIFSYVLGVWVPQVLRPVWRAWMGLAHVLGTVMTFVILAVCWTILVIPTAVTLKLLKKKVMAMDFRENVSSYWEVKEDSTNDFKLLERQF